MESGRPFTKPGSPFMQRLATTPAKDGSGMSGQGAGNGQAMESPEKGGHSLRKRTRVNYATEQIEDEVVVPNSSSTARGRKRKLDVGFDDIDTMYGPRNKRRGASVGDTPSTRRRNPARKGSEIAPFRDFEEEQFGNDEDEDEDIQDTIEVGLSPSEITDEDEEDEDDEDEKEDEKEDDDDDDKKVVEKVEEPEEPAEPVVSGEATEPPVGPESTPVPAPPSKAQEDEVASPATTRTAAPAEVPASPKDVVPFKGEDDDVPATEVADKETEEAAPIATPIAAPITAPFPSPQPPSPPPADDKSAEDKPAEDKPTEDKPVEQPEESLQPADQETLPTDTKPSADREPSPEEEDDRPSWARLRAWLSDGWTVYPERLARPDDDAASEAPSQEDKDVSKETTDALATTEEAAETPAVATEDPTPAQATPARGSLAPEIPDLTAPTSPAPAGEEPEEAESSASQEPQEKTRQFRYRTLPDPEKFISEIENFAEMSTDDLYNMLLVVNDAMVDWERQYQGCNRIIDDFENAERRRAADAKYEARTRNLNQHGINWEEPEFVMKGYKAKEKENAAETRQMQAQDRIMAAAYGFEYDPHPSKIGRQNPIAQQAGITTRGRSLRNQPRQTAKATESDVGLTGKRQRKPVQLFDPAPQEESRGSTPAPTRKRRRNANTEGNEDGHPASSFQTEASPEAEAPPSGGRRKRVRKAAAPRIVEESATATFPSSQDPPVHDEQTKTSGRRGRPKVGPKTEDVDFVRPSIEDEPHHSEPVPTRMLTLKIPKGTHLSGPSSEITDNGESPRPSTANSDSTAHTVESSYSFRPKRQKHFRDAPSDTEGTPEEPPKKKKRFIVKKRASPGDLASVEPEAGPSHAEPNQNGPETTTTTASAPRKAKARAPKYKDHDSRNGTPASQHTDGGEDAPKDYSTMTKSEKMSASMRSKSPTLSPPPSERMCLPFANAPFPRPLEERQHAEGR